MTQAQLDHYIHLLKEYNTHTNIYSVSAYDHLAYHIQDSVNITTLFPKNTRSVLDIGSGSGLPSIPMAITCPKVLVTAIESKTRKTRFLTQVKTTLALNNLDVVTANITEYIHQKKPNPSVITAKAFAPIDRLLPLLKTLAYTRATVIIPISEIQRTHLETLKYPSFIAAYAFEQVGVDHLYLKMELKKSNS